MHRAASVLAMLSAFVVMAAACGGPPREKVEFASEEATVDGLKLVDATNGHETYVKPGVAIRDFDSVLVDSFMISYTSPREAHGDAVRTLDKKTEARLLGLMRDIFMKQMGNSRSFAVVDHPGPRTIRVQGWLYDIVVEEPPREDPRNFPLCFAEMQAILTVRHSETAEALARVVDRVKLSCSAPKHARFYSAQWRDVESAVRPWAIFLRNWLEELRELPPAS
jgi:hypothetical protein